MTRRRILFILPLLALLGAGRRAPAPSPDLYYLGEGWATLARDAGGAREQAKARALGDLARNVRVTVRSALVDVLGEADGRIRTRLESRVEALAALPPTTLDREDYFLHRPARGQIACRVAVNRARFDETLRRDLARKAARVIEDARLAARARREGRPADALAALASLRARAAADLPGLPVPGDPWGDGVRGDVVAWGRAESEAWAADARLTVQPDRHIYDALGQGAAPVRVRFAWRDGARSLAGLALSATWSHHPDRVIARALTDGAGEATFAPTADPFFSEATLCVGLDPAVWGATRPALGQADFHRRRTIRLDVRGERPDATDALRTALCDELRRLPWDVIWDEASSASETDYVWRWEVSVRVDKHPDAPLYAAALETRQSLERRREGTAPQAGRGPRTSGRGGTAAQAVQEALHEARRILPVWAQRRAADLP